MKTEYRHAFAACAGLMALVLLALCLLCSCPNSLGTRQMVAVRISAEGPSSGAKTILPTSSVELSSLTGWVLKGTISGGSETTYGSWSSYSAMAGETLTLEAGTYSFTLTASGSTASYSSTLSNQIVSLSSATLSFAMEIATAGTGTVNFTGSYTTADLDAFSNLVIKGGLYTLASSVVSGYEDEVLTPAISGTSTVVTYHKENVPAGSYFLKIRFYDNTTELPIYYDELVTVAGDLTSEPSAAVKLVNPGYHTIVYNGNQLTGVGTMTGSVPTDSTKYMKGQTVTVADNTGSLVYTRTDTVNGIVISSGYHFKGWATSADAVSAEYPAGSTFTMGSADVALYAVWTRYYTVVYQGNGSTEGSEPTDSTEYEEGSSITVLGNTGSLACTRTDTVAGVSIPAGSHFKGWATSASAASADYSAGNTFAMGSANVALYAVWTPYYKVVYQGNGNTGGSVPTDSTEYEEGNSIAVLGNTGSLARTDCAFKGWAASSDATKPKYTAGDPITTGTADVLLYAVWYGTASITITMPSYSEIGTITDTESTSGHTFSLSTAYSSYQWYLDGVAKVTTAGYTMLYSSLTSGGTHSILIVVTDSSGNTRSATIQVTVAK